MFYQQFYMSFFNLLYKWGTDVMSANYEILRPVTPADLDVNPRFVKILKMIPREGHVTRDQFKSLETNAVNKCMLYAVSSGILKRVLIYERVLKLESVKFWCTHSIRIKDPDKFSKKLLPIARKIDIVCIIRTHVLRSNLYTNILVVIQL